MNRKTYGRILYIVSLLVLFLLVGFLPEGLPRQIPAFLLLWVFPAVGWTFWGHDVTGSFLERFLMAAGLALLVNTLAGFLSDSVFGLFAFNVAMVPIWYRGVVDYLSGKTGGREGQAESSRFLRVNWLLVGVMALALFLRLGNMGYKELQGDEGVIMVRAAAVLTGDGDQLFLHQKGPIEILLPMMPWGMTGSINEFWARLPFTWAGWLGVALIFVLGRRWFGRSAGLWAALLFAIGGFGIAFSRIIQYQTLVMLWGGLSLLTAVRYREHGRRSDLILSAVFLAGGLLAHYDAILVVPAVAVLVLSRVRQEKQVDWWGWGTAVLLGLFILGLFYVPFVLNPNFERTFSYLLQGRVGTDESGLPFSWSGAEVWQMITFYNSLWYVLGMLGLMLAGVGRLLAKRERWAIALYFLVPLLFYTLVVGDPRTHVYTLFPGAVILAGVGAKAVWKRREMDQAGSRAIQRGLLIAIALVSTLYVYLLFVDVAPERQRTWAENRPLPDLYPTTWQEPPLYGLFGFPHQAGWRAMASLVSSEELPYASNEEEEITNYYMGQAPRTHCRDFETFFLVSNVQDEIPYEPEWLAGYFPQEEIIVGEGPVTMMRYTRGEGTETAVRVLDDVTLWRTPEEVRPPQERGETAVEVNLSDKVVLAGYDLSADSISPGDTLTLRLYWEVLAPFERNKQVFVHLFNGEVIAQDDGAPECGVNPTTRWEPGQIIVDPHQIEIPVDIEPVSLELIVGMYDLLDSTRLERLDGQGDSILLTEVKVR